MLTFSTDKKELAKALGVVSLAAADNSDRIWGHALFRVSDEGNMVIYATDKDRLGTASCPVTNVTNLSEVSEFTADPKKMTALLSSSDREDIMFKYIPEEKTVQVHASDNSNSYVSFPSLDPNDFLSFEDVLKNAHEVKTFNAGVLLTGLRFIQGFLPNDDRQPKFARMYIEKGVLYGSNGSSKIGAFQSPEFEGLDELIIRRQMLAPISAMIDRSDMSDVVVKESAKFLLTMSSDGRYGFGFLKTTDKMIKFPINMGKLEGDTFSVERDPLLRKINRLAIMAGKELGLKMILGQSDLTIATVMERPSIETIECQRTGGEEEKEFVVDYQLIKPALGLFQTPEIETWVGPSNCIMRSDASLEIQEEGEQDPSIKKFTAVGLISLARVLS